MDATVGGGGHAALLRELGAEVLAVDRDPDAIAAARARLGDSGVRYSTGPFGSAKVLGTIETFRPDRILLDLGVSSHQLDTDTRGFTFRPGAPLDMRMAAGRGVTAADILNTWPAERLAAAFATSDDLVNAIREARGPRAGPAVFARLFQALRIVVNQELEQLDLALPALRATLPPGGRIAAITYHSGEDRIVKHAFRDWSRSCVCPPGQPVCTCRGRPLGTVLTKKPLRPDAAEIRDNPRARSARFRAFEVGEGDAA